MKDILADLKSTYRINPSDEAYIRGDKVWDTATLIRYVEEQKLPVFNLPLVGIDLCNRPFDVSSFGDFIYHMDRAMNVNLDYPIILDDCGQIANGWHRIALAFMYNKPTIKAVRLLCMPKPSRTIESKAKTFLQ